jgi:hypothetical protein
MGCKKRLDLFDASLPETGDRARRPQREPQSDVVGDLRLRNRECAQEFDRIRDRIGSSNPIVSGRSMSSTSLPGNRACTASPRRCPRARARATQRRNLLVCTPANAERHPGAREYLTASRTFFDYISKEIKQENESLRDSFERFLRGPQIIQHDWMFPRDCLARNTHRVSVCFECVPRTNGCPASHDEPNHHWQRRHDGHNPDRAGIASR